MQSKKKLFYYFYWNMQQKELSPHSGPLRPPKAAHVAASQST